MDNKLKVLLICNWWLGEGDFRWGLYTTLLRNDRFLIHHTTLNNGIDRVIDEFKPEIIISIKQWFNKEQLEKLKKIGSILIQLFPDDPDEYEKIKKYIPQFDLWFTNSMWARDNFYHEDGFDKVKVCGFATDPYNYKGVNSSDEYKCDIMFAGGENKKKYRYGYLNALEKYDLKIFGQWSKYVHGNQNKILRGAEYFSAIKSAKIGIDFSISGSGYFNVKSKTFELTAGKCFVLTNRFKEMENYFEYDKEVVGFAGIDEFKDKIKYYLKHDAERKKIAQEGYNRFMKSHTWKHRLKKVFKNIGLKY